MFSRHCVLLSWIASISRFEPWLFHSNDFEIVHDISFLLADGTIMYDAYSTLMMWFRVRFAYTTRIRWCCLFSDVTSELWRDWGCEPVSSICHSSFWWGCEYRNLLTKPYRYLCSKLLYVSYATDWPGVSVGHHTGALAIFVVGYFDMVDLRFYVMFCPEDFYFPMCYTHTFKIG